MCEKLELPIPNDTESLMKIAQKNVIEIEWWKDKLFRIIEMNEFTISGFTEDEEKTIYKEYKKWRNKNE